MAKSGMCKDADCRGCAGARTPPWRDPSRSRKPPNVVVTPEGRAKVLPISGWRAGFRPRRSRICPSPAESVCRTRAGWSPGRWRACVASELFRRATPDARSDIWSLGVLLYEMATGIATVLGRDRFRVERPFTVLPRAARAVARPGAAVDPDDRRAVSRKRSWRTLRGR